MSELDPSGFDVLTFDCYGTLIDWETGLLGALHPILGRHGVEAADEELLEAYGRHEAALEAGEYLRYADVLAQSLQGLGRDFGFEPDEVELQGFASSVAQWPAFGDSAQSLARLKERFALGVITNCDDDLFAASNRKLGVEFDYVITAQQVGAYKPSPRGFEVAFERIDAPRERILHVAQSLFHDHVVAKSLGLTTVWIDRRSGKAGAGATPPAEAAPDAVFADMASFADAVV